MCREAKSWSHLLNLFPAEVKQGDASRFSSLTVNKCPFQGLLSATFFRFLCVRLFFFKLVILLLKMARKCSVVLACVPKSKEAVAWVIEQMHVLGKLLSDGSYSGLGCEFSIHDKSRCL